MQHPLRYPALLAAALVLHLAAGAQGTSRGGGSVFRFGFARIEAFPADTAGGRSTEFHYIDTSGQVAFDTIIAGSFGERGDPDDPAAGADSILMPEHFVVVKKGRKTGVLTESGQWILKPLYDSVNTIYRYNWVVKKDGKRSLFDRKHGFLLPFRFDMAYAMDGNFFNVTKDGKWGVYSRNNDSLVVPCIYQDMDYCYGCGAAGDYCFAEKDGKWGVIAFDGRVLVPFAYDHEHTRMRTDEWVYSLYRDGTELSINLRTHRVDTFRDPGDRDADTVMLAGGFRRIQAGDKYGLVNPAGKVVLPARYDYVKYEADTTGSGVPAPFVSVGLNARWGMADTTGHILVSPGYDSELQVVADSFFLGEAAGREMLLSAAGKKAIPGTYDDIVLEKTGCDCDSVTHPYFKLVSGGRYGMYNPLTGAWASPRYDDLDNFMFGLSLPHCVKVRQGGLTGVLDIRTAHLVMAPLFHSIATEGLPPGMMIVGNDGKYGIYDYAAKKLLVPLAYDHISVPGGGRVLIARKDEKKGLIDYSGNVICPIRYLGIKALDDSVYLLTRQDSSFRDAFRFFHLRNFEVSTPSYDSVMAVEADTLAIVRDQGTYRLWNPLTGQLIEGPYSEGGFPKFMDYFTDGRTTIHKNGKAAVIDARGNYIIAPRYVGISSFHHDRAIVLSGQDSTGQRLYGFIDTTGALVVPPRYSYDDQRQVDDYFPDSSLLLLHRQDPYAPETVGKASWDGTVVIPPVYDRVYPGKGDRYYLVIKGKKYGVLDASGHALLPVAFDDVAVDMSESYRPWVAFSFPLLAKRGKRWSYYRRDGTPLDIRVKEIIPFNDLFNY